MSDRFDIDEVRLTDYLYGECSSQERDAIERWIAARPEHRLVVARVRAALHSVQVHTPAPIDVTAFRHAIETRAGIASAAASSTGAARLVPLAKRPFAEDRGGRRRWIGTTMMACVAVLAALGIRAASRSLVAHDVKTYATHTAQRMTVTLDDGTRVVLAPETHLSVASNFGRGRRTVALSGEAQFSVIQVTGAPFLVRTGSVTTRVLGTVFSVRYYAPADTVQVAVLSGKVASGGHGMPLAITAGHIARITDSTATAMGASGAHTFVDWERERLIFKDERVSTMLASIGRWYGYRFNLVDSVLATQEVSAAFKMSDPSDMLAILSAVLDVHMTFDGNLVTLTPRRTSGRPSDRRPPSLPARNDVMKPSLEMGR